MKVDDAGMRKRVLVWSGAVAAVAAMVGLGVYFTRVGLEDADKVASVIGVFVALVGLAVAIYGLRGGRSPEAAGTDPGPSPGPGSGSGSGSAQPNVSAPGTRSVAIGGDNTGVVSTGDGATNVQMRAEASGQARIYQAGGDQTINEK
ncbi:hypothetical protein [Nonomuraea sp. NPDC050643]|uniref:hypothetical protein n=1 Tax=Nonomuraea sp. NPDC050643 TaxID=3155660 RepID=UPI0034107A6A